MVDRPVIVLPPLLGGQAQSWVALVELAPAFGHNWLLVGGQMVFCTSPNGSPPTSDRQTTSMSSSTSVLSPPG